MEPVKNSNVFELSNPKYTASFQRICGIYIRDCDSARATPCYTSNEQAEQDQKHGEETRKRNGFGKHDTVSENNNISREYDGKNRTPNKTNKESEIDSIWPHLTFAQKCIFYLLSSASSLGNEVFYLLFYPFVAWNLDSVLVRRTSVVWCLCMYAGEAAKDYLRWSRPSSPPVVRLETNFLQEFAMPSTHAMSATAIPFMLAYTIISRYEISPVLVVTIAVCWCLLVCLSRLYLGVHSIMDLVCGVVSALFIILLMVPHMKSFDMFQQSHPVAPLVILGISVALSTVCYPCAKDRFERYSTKGDAVQIVAVIAGVTLGTWINYQYGFTVDKGQVYQAKIEVPSVTMVIESLLRFVIGIAILACIYVTMKFTSIRFFSYIFNLEKPNKKHPSVETAYKFCTYYALGVAIIFLVPYIHFLLGLGRAAYFNEVQ